MANPDQIEAKAFEIFQIREANLRRRFGVGYLPGKFAGDERDNCIATAAVQLEREAYDRQQAQAVIDSMGHMSNADLRRIIGSIERRRATPGYFIATRSVEEISDYADLSKYRDELKRRATGLHAMMEAAE